MSASSVFCASAFFSLLVACNGKPAPGSASTSGSASAVSVSGSASASPSASGSASASASASESASDSGAGVDPYLTASPVSAKSIGHTSYVLKLTLSGGAKAAYKPRSRLPLGDRRYRAEIAAYRLALALGIDNVPRAIPRSFDAASPALRSAEDFATRALVDPDGRIRGALMPWIEQYRVLPLEEASWRSRWESWLTEAAAPIPDGDKPMAAAISTMIVFDYVTANWDRWSGANVAQDGATGKLLYVDNDGAFYESPPADALARQLALLQRVRRFSKSFVDALRALDRGKMLEAFAQEAPGVPLLPDKVVDAADARRQTALRAIDARVGDAGAAATLFF
jgi:hypothetical protein